jgi:ABC-type sugar transport system permease subunit
MTRRLSREQWNALYGYLFAVPALLFLLVFIAYPLMESIRMSLFRWDGLTPPDFRGLSNYQFLFLEDTVFWRSVGNTLLYSALSVTGIVGIGFLLAIAIERRVGGWPAYKIIWFLPVILSQTVVSILWAKFYDPTGGLINDFLALIGVGNNAIEWLGNPDLVMYSATFVSVWQYAGYSMILLLAAMEGVPVSVHDAATIDGVGPVRRVVSITFPMIRPVFSVVVMLILINSLKTFDTIYVLTGGGPGDASTVLSIHLYKNAFQFYSFGYASTIATVMFIILFTVGLVYQRFLRVDGE